MIHEKATVTLNMLNHADALGLDLSGEQYAEVYRAMHAVAPVELVSEGERIAVSERDACRSELLTAREIIDRDTRMIADQAALITKLMAASMAHSAPDQELALPQPNPFRDFPGDRRRIGG